MTFVELDRERYDELVRKEALLDTIRKLHWRMSDYAFRDVVGHLFKTAEMESANEEAANP